MRIATWNVNSIKARQEFVLGWLARREPDVVLLQELKVTSAKFPFDAFREAGYEAVVHAQPTWNGVAVLSRRPVALVQAGLPAAEEAGARVVTARVEDLTVTSVYVPNGKAVAHPDYRVKLDFLGALADYVGATHDPAGLALVGGDFNLCPGDLDTYDPVATRGRIHHTEAERERLARLQEHGMVDLYRALHPSDTMYTWWDYRAGNFHKNIGLRIDLLLASEPLRAATREVWVDRDYRKKQDGLIPSDHAPVIADVEL